MGTEELRPVIGTRGIVTLTGGVIATEGVVAVEVATVVEVDGEFSEDRVLRVRLDLSSQIKTSGVPLLTTLVLHVVVRFESGLHEHKSPF